MAATATATVKTKKPRRKPGAFLKRYGRVLIGGTLVAILILVAIFAPLLTQYDPNAVDMSIAKMPPNAEHWFGTDIYGRDLFSRTVYGSRITIELATDSCCVYRVDGRDYSYARHLDSDEDHPENTVLLEAFDMQSWEDMYLPGNG